jgi:hypothetical protein
MVNETGVPPTRSALEAGNCKSNTPEVVSKEQLNGPAVKPVKAVHVGAPELNIHILLEDEGFHLGVAITRL